MSDRPLTTDVAQPLLDKIQAATFKYSYKGIPMVKNPFDLALYPKLLWEAKPRTIIEIGSNAGGSAVWFADQVRSMQLGAHVYSMDINPVEGVSDPLVTFITSNLEDVARVMPVEWVASLPRPLFIVEDASHIYEHSLFLLKYFADHMRAGEYYVVEDAIVTALGLADNYNGGPGRAIAEFLRERPDFALDQEICDFYGFNVTWNVNGFLKKITPSAG